MKQVIAIFLVGLFCFGWQENQTTHSVRAGGEAKATLNPAAWGADHVGKPVPEYMTGDECLFCHRKDVGPSWGSNRHHLTIREFGLNSPAGAALKQSKELTKFAEEVKLILGDGRRERFLRPAPQYGKLDLLSTSWQPKTSKAEGKLLDTQGPHWDARRFGDSCAGCHCTGADGVARTFSSPGIDCYSCHGQVTLEHSKDTSLVHLAKKRKDPARVVASICGQCHIRTGTAKSTALPYPNNFVPGDNLFRDFKVDFSAEKINRLNPGDRHVLENIRDIVINGKEETTCLSCHSVHGQSARKHHRVAAGDICLNCHQATGPKKLRKMYEVHSDVCGY